MHAIFVESKMKDILTFYFHIKLHYCTATKCISIPPL